MLLQVEVPAEALHTEGTREGLLVAVGVHVELEVVGVVERLWALRTFVALLAAVRQLVVLVVPILMEALATDLA